MHVVPMVSVCCSTYNHERYIEDAIKGFLSQETSFPIEIIIHDDASDDDTPNIIRKYAASDERIKPILREENIQSAGVPVSPILYSQAKGKYLALCDGDDHWTDPLKLQKQVSLLESRSDLVSCYHNVSVQYEDGRVPHLYLDGAQQRETSTIKDLIRRDFIPNVSSVSRNDFIKRLPDCFSCLPFGDWSYHVITAQYGNIGYIDEVMATYRVHRRGIGSRGLIPEECDSNAIRVYEDALQFYSVLESYLGKEYSGIIRHERSNRHWQLALRYAHIRDYPRVRKHLRLAVSADPLNREIWWRRFAQLCIESLMNRPVLTQENER